MKITARMSKYLADPVIKGRECGECTVCCVLPRIQDRPWMTSLPLIDEPKPGYTPCKHLGETGCGRYEERPPVCSEFACLWRSGHIAGDERRRPDKLGLMFTLDAINGKGYLEVWEVWPGAACNDARFMLDAIAGFVPNIVVRYYGVPCSLSYHRDPLELLDGVKLSKAALEQPQALGQWLRNLAATHGFTDIPDEAAESDIAALEAGVKMVAHFKPRGQ